MSKLLALIEEMEHLRERLNAQLVCTRKAVSMRLSTKPPRKRAPHLFGGPSEELLASRLLMEDRIGDRRMIGVAVAAQQDLGGGWQTGQTGQMSAERWDQQLKDQEQ